MTDSNRPSWQYIPPSSPTEGEIVDATRYMKGAPNTRRSSDTHEEKTNHIEQNASDHTQSANNKPVAPINDTPENTHMNTQDSSVESQNDTTPADTQRDSAPQAHTSADTTSPVQNTPRAYTSANPAGSSTYEPRSQGNRSQGYRGERRADNRNRGYEGNGSRESRGGYSSQGSHSERNGGHRRDSRGPREESSYSSHSRVSPAQAPAPKAGLWQSIVGGLKSLWARLNNKVTYKVNKMSGKKYTTSSYNPESVGYKSGRSGGGPRGQGGGRRRSRGGRSRGGYNREGGSRGGYRSNGNTPQA